MASSLMFLLDGRESMGIMDDTTVAAVLEKASTARGAVEQTIRLLEASRVELAVARSALESMLKMYPGSHFAYRAERSTQDDARAAIERISKFLGDR